VHGLDRFGVHAHRSAERINLNGARRVHRRDGINIVLVQSLQPLHTHGFDLLARLLVGFLRKCRDEQKSGQHRRDGPY
jgi:hypothetical protein